MTAATLDHLTPMQKTLLITLKGRAVDARSRRPLLGDDLALDTLDRLGRAARQLRLPTGVRESVAIRSRMLDRAVQDFIRRYPDAVVVEVGCGLETRRSRLDVPESVDWYDQDFPEVIALRRELLPPRENVHQIGRSLFDPDWLEPIPRGRPTIIVADGVLGFLSEADNRRVLMQLTDHVARGELVFNAYTPFVARMNGRFTQVVGMPKEFRGFGFSDPEELVALNPRLTFLEEQFGDAAPERELLNPAYRLLGRWFAAWPAQARRGVWIVRYRF
ncbi:MAG TPA: class I SAM-dependent methyltransferase [Candidatus Ruania gallistercoris]|uniref:Class I SAM-dependent methyltransferase n=1 Tax=Candidatus Ruania gallistercoris TaxID=2838746 RepID=A0A9D2EDZ1_9MICO|nr:class I SAM-dependent methyltransferase [Candidatus Ruania gallistercoris]